MLPTQIDYADYRDTNGVKIPYRWTLARPSGRFTIQVSEVKQNVPVDDAKFVKPAASDSEIGLLSQGRRIGGVTPRRICRFRIQGRPRLIRPFELHCPIRVVKRLEPDFPQMIASTATFSGSPEIMDNFLDFPKRSILWARR